MKLILGLLFVLSLSSCVEAEKLKEEIKDVGANIIGDQKTCNEAPLVNVAEENVSIQAGDEFKFSVRIKNVNKVECPDSDIFVDTILEVENARFKLSENKMTLAAGAQKDIELLVQTSSEISVGVKHTILKAVLYLGGQESIYARTTKAVFNVVETDTPQPAAPILNSAVLSDGNYILSFSQPEGSLAPAGGYDTYFNGADQNDNSAYSGFTRTITGLDTQTEQCFKLEARYTQLNPAQFPQSNEICVAAESQEEQNPVAPVLNSAVYVEGSYVLTFSQPQGSLAPAGNYDTIINGNDLNDRDNYSGFTRTIVGLASDMQQCFRIQARYIQLSPAQFLNSNQVCVEAQEQNSDQQAPSIPSGLAQSSVSQSSIAFSWNASSDNVAVTGYVVEQNGSVVGETASTNYSASGLAANTSYTFKVAAKDAAGNQSAFSVPITITTLESDGGSDNIPTDGRAFPGAVGGGAFARTNVQYTHRVVTNLNASGPGSFRDAIKSNSIVTFAVSGVADSTNLTYSGIHNVIILGQTAPQGGFQISGPGIRWDDARNVVMRHISIRNTWPGRDNLDFVGARDVIIDHSSFSFGGDETVSFRAYPGAESIVKNISFTNNIVSYAKTGMLMGDSNYLEKNTDMSVIGNLWGVTSHRFPNPNGHGRFDIIGNVVWHWLNRLMRTQGNFQLNEIANYYHSPQNSSARHELGYGNGATPLVYTALNRNAGMGINSDSDDNRKGYRQALQIGTEPQAPAQYFSSQMFPLLNMDASQVQSADWWYNRNVTQGHVGNYAYLDNNGNKAIDYQSVDALLLHEIRNNIHLVIGKYDDWFSAGDYKEFPARVNWLANESNVKGVIINQHSSATHTATVPNSWISSKGLNPATFNPVGNDLHPLYTNIEIYSFGVDN